MASNFDDKLKSVKQRAEAQIEQSEREYRQQLLRHRIETATQGVKLYKQGKLNDAMLKFFSYLKIMEDWKGCGSGELTPGLFDMKKDISELLLISGIYWDLAKVYDQIRGKQNNAHVLFTQLLGKFVLFSRGMSYQPLCAETLRRYLLGSRVIHRAEIRAAYKELSNSKCFVATALVDVLDWETLPRLRAYRDGTLSRSGTGRALIALYYAVGPIIAQVVERLPRRLRAGLGLVLDRISRALAGGISEGSSRSDRV